MTVNEEVGPKVDKQGRIVDSTGRPLRDGQNRDHGPVPFRGKSGKSHPKEARLRGRIAVFEADKSGRTGRKRPGSYNK